MPTSAKRKGALFAAIAALAAMLVLATPGSIKADLPPAPIVPAGGDQNLLSVANTKELNDIASALKSFPVPYVIYAQAGSGPPVVINQKAGSPQRVDADSSKATGYGGNDIQVIVTQKLTPVPHLQMEINRLGVAPFATNVKVEIAFPWAAFNSETALPGAPNLFIGYQTTAVGGGDGGTAPVSEVINFTPNILAGTAHTFDVTMNTTGASNPVRFLAGGFDGTNLTGVLDARAIGALVDSGSPSFVPSTIDLGVGVSESALSPGPGGTDTALNLTWTASAASKVTFQYLEDQSTPTTSFDDYDTTLTVDQMPTSDTLSLHLNEAAGTMTLENTASAPIHAITFVKRRHDGLTITGRAGDVPTHVLLTVNLSGTATLDVNANTLDLELTLEEAGGFANTQQFLGYNLGYLDVQVNDAPDLTMGYIPSGDKFGVQASNPGESIGAVQFVIGDDSNLELPPTWSDMSRHEFSLIDDGTHGTAAARIVHLQEATLNLNPSPTGELYNLVVGQAAPLNAYIQTTPTSNLIPGHDVLADCHVINVPSGHLTMSLNLPDQFSYTTDPPQGISDVGCTGHVDSLNFDVSMADLPPVFGWDFDPAGHMTVKAEDGTGPNTATVGLIAVRLWDQTGPGLPSSSGLFGVALRDARARVDQIPSFHGTWATGGTGTAIDYHNDAGTNFLGGAQVDVSTEVGLAALPAAGPSAQDYGRFVDNGGGGSKEFAAGAFGINTFSYSSNDATRNLSVHYKANAAHQLGLTFNSRFGGTYFPNYDINASLTVDSVPQSFDLSTNLATNFDYTASSGISSIGLSGDIDTTNNGDSGDSVHVEASVHGLPASASLDVDPSASGHATFTMASPIDSVNLDVTGGEGIFGSPIKQVHLAIDHIPANWHASWDGTGADVTAVGDHVNAISLIVSEGLPASNAAMLAPFVAGGGAIGYSTWLRTIDDQWAQVGGNSPQRETDIMSRLDDIYSSTTSLGSGEDHVVYIPDGSTPKYLDVQLTNLQGASFHSTSNSVTASFTDPVSGDHPVFTGIGQSNGDFLTVGLQNLPDQIDFDALEANPGHAHFDSNEPAGRVQVYQGPLPTAADSNTATKFIVPSLPSSMHLDWNFSFPNGSGTFTASSPIEIRFLHQDGSTRLVGAVTFQNLSIGYGVQGGNVSSDDCLPVPPFTCNESVDVIDASAGFSASPGVSGMLLVYPFESSPETANGITPSSSGEYRPELSFLLKNLTEISADAGIRVCFLPLGFPPCLVGAPLPFAGFTVNATAANVDFWDNGGGPANILGDPDYVGNNPWRLYPFLYGDSSRIDPFS